MLCAGLVQVRETEYSSLKRGYSVVSFMCRTALAARLSLECLLIQHKFPVLTAYIRMVICC